MNYPMTYLLPNHQTERLQFRLLTEDDYNTWLRFWQHPTAGLYFGMHDAPEVNCRNWMDRVLGRYAAGTGGLHALIEKETGAFVGQCGVLLQELDGEQRLEIGYSLMPAFWGMGFATEAASACKHEAFTRGWTNELISIVHVDNEPSKKVAQRNGMSLWKTTDFKGFPVEVFRVKKN